MPHIDVDQPVVTMIQVFTVQPKHQDRLVQLLIEATETVMCQVPGFVSASFHASVDGTRVTNYAQWRSEAHYEAMLNDPVVHQHFGDIQAITSKPDRNLYRVVHTKQSVQDGARR